MGGPREASKCPEASHTSEPGRLGLLTRQLQMVERYLVQTLVAGSKKGRGLKLTNEDHERGCARQFFMVS